MKDVLSRRNFLRGLLLANLALGLKILLPVESIVAADAGPWQPVLPAAAQPPLAVDPVSPHTKPSMIYVNG